MSTGGLAQLDVSPCMLVSFEEVTSDGAWRFFLLSAASPMFVMGILMQAWLYRVVIVVVEHVQ